MPTLDVFGVVVSDMAAAVAFYRRLGLVFPDGAEKEEHVSATLGGGVQLMLDAEDLIRQLELDDRLGGRGRVALAVRCADPAEVDRIYAELAADGHGTRPPWDAFWGQRYAVVHDPDGTPVDLYAPLPS
ncbi:MAG TPA: VOC family protein [Cryptosporangiaceae bacterium]|nr:VOC family protein [Cryptosporangiaceae bacterium]